MYTCTLVRVYFIHINMCMYFYMYINMNMLLSYVFLLVFFCLSVFFWRQVHQNVAEMDLTPWLHVSRTIFFLRYLYERILFLSIFVCPLLIHMMGIFTGESCVFGYMCINRRFDMYLCRSNLCVYMSTCMCMYMYMYMCMCMFIHMYIYI